MQDKQARQAITCLIKVIGMAYGTREATFDDYIEKGSEKNVGINVQKAAVIILNMVKMLASEMGYEFENIAQSDMRLVKKKVWNFKIRTAPKRPKRRSKK